MADPIQVDVYLCYPKTSTTYETVKMRCETWQYVIGRQHMVQGLPGMRKNVGGEPGCLALDFGSMTEDIILRGAISDHPAYVGGEYDTGTRLLEWPEIEEIFRTSWRYYVMGWMPTMPCILVFYDDQGFYYEHHVLPGKLHLTRDVREEWRFAATFHTVKWSWT